MMTIPVKCPACGGTRISKNGKEGVKQRYLCGDKSCPGSPSYWSTRTTGWKLGINAQIINMAANASGICDTAQVLKVSKQKASDALKKQKKRRAGSTSGI